MTPDRLYFKVQGGDFTALGRASVDVKRELLRLGAPAEDIRRAAIAMYEGEVNMAIHAGGGIIEADIYPGRVEITLTDEGPGIPDVEAAMRENWSTASEEIRRLGFGAGMGLPNMKRNSDELKIDTEVGKGTRVFVRINFADNKM